MGKLTVEYVQKFMIDANCDISDGNGNWFGIRKYYNKFRVVRNGHEFYTGNTLEKCVKVINKEII